MKYSWLTGTVALLLVGVLTVYALQLEQKLVLTSAQLKMGETLDRAEKEMITSLATLEQMFLGFGQYLELFEQLPDPDEGALRRTMDTLVQNNSFMVSLVVTDGSGDILHWTNSGPKPNLSGRSYFDVHNESLVDGVYLSAPLPSIMSPGQWILGASKALRYPDECLSRVLVAIIDTRRLFSVLEGAATESAGVLTVLSPGGDVLARSPDHHQIVGSNQPDLLEGWRPTTAAENIVTTRVIDGRKQLLMVRHLATYGLVIRAEAPLNALTDQQSSRLLPLIGGGALVALLLLWQLSSMLHLQRNSKDLQNQLRAETRRDPLTGLPLWQSAKDEPIAGNDDKPPLALLMIGLDGYSRLLVEQGEEQANQLVVQGARVLAQSLPTAARMHRYLCSRFMVLLPEADQSRALEVAEQIRATLEAEAFEIGSSRINLTVSIGISALAVDEADPTMAINRAATALTTATTRGGNQAYWQAARESWLEQKA